MAEPEFALSLKQPWAALLASGRKTIEVRRWPTARRGRFLIHAARVSDPRPEVWEKLPDELQRAAKLVGGIVGEAELLSCVTYRDRETFAIDREEHLNDPAWFEGTVLYGFKIANARVLPFRAYSGWVRFFRVETERRRPSREQDVLGI